MISEAVPAGGSATSTTERDKWGRKLVPCKWCSAPTAMTGTNMCDGCWELERRIERNPDLARRILAALGADGAQQENLQALFRSTGYVTSSQASTLASLAVATVGDPCPVCDGTGRIEGEPCDTCVGTGSLPDTGRR